MIKKTSRTFYVTIYIGLAFVILALGLVFSTFLNAVLSNTLNDVAAFSSCEHEIGIVTNKMMDISIKAVVLYTIIGLVLLFITGKRFFVKPLRELEEMSKNMEAAQTMLMQQEKLASIGELAAGVAHELNNPIGFVNSNISALKDYLPELKSYIAYLEEKAAGNQTVENPATDIDFILSDIPDLVDESLDGLSRVTSIVKSLKDYARVDIEDRVDYNINEGIEATLTVSRNTYKYVAEIHKNLQDVPLLIANGNQINEVLLNLFVNAAQAIEMKELKGKGNMTIETFADDRYVYCIISDDGIGINEETQKKIFDPFFTTKEPGKGTGLGLNIAYNTIVNKHNGDISVESTLGEGTVFTIKLPIEREIDLYENS